MFFLIRSGMSECGKNTNVWGESGETLGRRIAPLHSIPSPFSSFSPAHSSSRGCDSLSSNSSYSSRQQITNSQFPATSSSRGDGDD